MTIETAVASGGINTSPEILRQMLAEGMIDQEDFIALGGNNIMPDGVMEIKADDLSPEDSEILTRIVEDIDRADELNNIYGAEQTVNEVSPMETETEAEEVAAVAAPVVVEEKKPREKKASSVSRSRLSSYASQGDYVASFTGEKIQLFETLPDGERNEVKIVDLINGINAKKIREKAVNLCDHLYNNRALSVYTQIAVTQLRKLKHDDVLTAKNIAFAFTSPEYKKNGGGYSAGTCASQAQQQMTLLRTFGVIDSKGKLNNNSLVWSSLNK